MEICDLMLVQHGGKFPADTLLQVFLSIPIWRLCICWTELGHKNAEKLTNALIPLYDTLHTFLWVYDRYKDDEDPF
jgi:hypothetical protein